jgi:type IV pilus assembly protein PilQ
MVWPVVSLLFFVWAGAVAAEERISLDLNGMDVVDVIKTLGTKAGLSIVIDKNVAGRATVMLKDVTPLEALDVILASNGLARNAGDGVQRVMTVQDYETLTGVKPSLGPEPVRYKLKNLEPQEAMALVADLKSAQGRVIADVASSSLLIEETPRRAATILKALEAADVPLTTRGFAVNHAQAAKVAEAVREALTRGLGRVTVDERANKLVVRDRSEVLTRVALLIAELDTPAREVAIDAKIVQVNLGDKTALGIDWEYVLNEKVKVAGMFGQAISSTGNLWTIGHAALSEAKDYKAVIEALRTQGETRILSSPRLTVTDREAAKILVGSKQVYVTSSAVQSTTTTETAEAVNFVDVGVKLFVTPTIGTDGFISIKVRPEVSSVVETYRTAAGNAIPVVETSEAETTVLVPDGATVVIAGLMKDEKVKTLHKIPLLGDIPFLGALFRRSVSDTRKTELAVFLTCRVLTWKPGEEH